MKFLNLSNHRQTYRPMMKYLKILLLAVIMMPLSAMADKPKEKPGKGKHRERTEWFRKMKEVKHNYLAKELDLTDKQKNEFFKLYDAKESERFAAESKVRKLEKELKKKGDAATEADFDTAIAAQYRLNREIADIESKYEKPFRQILTKRQLFKLPRAERGFQHKLMDKRKDCPPPPPGPKN